MTSAASRASGVGALVVGWACPIKKDNKIVKNVIFFMLIKFMLLLSFQI
jgi:hypothetical protein